MNVCESMLLNLNENDKLISKNNVTNQTQIIKDSISNTEWQVTFYQTNDEYQTIKYKIDLIKHPQFIQNIKIVCHISISNQQNNIVLCDYGKYNVTINDNKCIEDSLFYGECDILELQRMFKNNNNENNQTLNIQFFMAIREINDIPIFPFNLMQSMLFLFILLHISQKQSNQNKTN